jgi:hypothetical protein
VNRNQDPVDGAIVENAVPAWKRLDGAKGLTVPVPVKDPQHILFMNH